MPSIIHLTNEYSQRASLACIRRDFGEKAYGIAMLQRLSAPLGFSVPQTWAINHEVNKRFLEDNNLTKEAISSIYRDNSRKTVRTSSKRTLSVLGGGEDLKTIYSKDILPKFEAGHFSLKDEKELRDAFETFRQANFRLNIRASQFDPIYIDPNELDFQRFSDIIKEIYARTFDPLFWSTADDEGKPEINNGVIIQEVPGHVQLIRGKESFFPVYSGITTVDPYSPITTISYRNLGLSAGKNNGEFFDKVAATISPNGKTQYSLSMPKKIPDRWRIACLQNGNYNYDISTIINPESLLKDRNTIEDLNSTLMKADYIARKLHKKSGVPIEITWSYDGYNLNLHQIESPNNKFDNTFIEIKDISKEKIIAEGRSVCGHGEIILPLIVTPSELESKNANILTITAVFNELIKEAAARTGGNFILAANIVEALRDKNSDDAFIYLHGMRGLINLSDEPLPLGSLWSNWFVDNNILVITSTNINKDLIGRICTNKTTFLGYSTYPVRMAVDLKSQRGQVHLIGQE